MKSIHRIGVDVSKSTLDVRAQGKKLFRVANTPQGIAKLAEQLPERGIVYLESSGGYERLACQLLPEMGFEVRVLDPLQARRYCQSQGRKAKTDQLDATALSEFGNQIPSRPPKSPHEMEIQDLSRAREALRDTVRENRLKAGAPELMSCVKDAYLQVAAIADQQAKQIQARLEKLLKAGESATDYRNVLTVPGVGPILAMTLLSELPLGWQDSTVRQLVSYSGLAPMDNQSGKLTKASRLGRGNPHIKGALYSPACSILRSQSWARSLYSRLRSQGKKHQQAIVAVMRKLLVKAIAVLKRGSPWRVEPATT